MVDIAFIQALSKKPVLVALIAVVALLCAAAVLALRSRSMPIPVPGSFVAADEATAVASEVREPADKVIVISPGVREPAKQGERGQPRKEAIHEVETAQKVETVEKQEDRNHDDVESLKRNTYVEEAKKAKVEEQRPVPKNNRSAGTEGAHGTALGIKVASSAHPPHQTYNKQQAAVVKAFKHAWEGYTKFAWGDDELLPLTKKGQNIFGLGLTIVDSLDTLWLMGLTEDFNKAQQWVAKNMNIEHNKHKVSVFETTIRVLGGLLSAYHLSEDKIFLQKAVQLGDRLLIAFSSPTGIPYGSVKLNNQPEKSAIACVAEMASIQLEFRDLSHSTRDPKYQIAVDKALLVLQENLIEGVATQDINVNSGILRKGVFTIGPRTDSYYEYLLKQWLQSGKREEQFHTWYSTAANTILRLFVKRSTPSHMAFLAQLYSLDDKNFIPRMDHLTCFFPGVLALGYLHGFPEEHLAMAKDLADTCYQLYHRSVSGLSPDQVSFNTAPELLSDFYIGHSSNYLRPETVESLFILYRVTQDPLYRKWGWNIFQAFEKHSKVPSGGYANTDKVDTPSPVQTNKMETFFLSETLKYLFLLFTNDVSVLPLDKWVFNTEGHPLPVWEA